VARARESPRNPVSIAHKTGRYARTRPSKPVWGDPRDVSPEQASSRFKSTVCRFAQPQSKYPHAFLVAARQSGSSSRLTTVDRSRRRRSEAFAPPTCPLGIAQLDKAPEPGTGLKRLARPADPGIADVKRASATVHSLQVGQEILLLRRSRSPFSSWTAFGGTTAIMTVAFRDLHAHRPRLSESAMRTWAWSPRG
jgi:hypothetical protein